MVTRSKTTLDRTSHQAFITYSEPSLVIEALASPQWSATMIEEYEALKRNGTWSLASLPPSCQPIGCK